MNKIRILTALVVVLLHGSNAYAQWVQSGLAGKSIYAFATDGTNIYAGTDAAGVYRSTNNGSTWDTVNTGLGNKGILSLLVTGNTLVAGTGGGVYYAPLSTLQWQGMNTGLTTTFVRTVLMQGSAVYAGTEGGGTAVFSAPQLGGSWTATPLSNTAVRILILQGTDIVAGTTTGIYRSTNGGAGWTAQNSGLTGTFVRGLATVGSNLVAGTSSGVFVSTSNSGTWASSSNGLTNTSVEGLYATPTAIYAATAGGVFQSTDAGSNWAAMNSGLTTLTVRSLFKVGNYLYVGSNGGGIFRYALAATPSITVTSPNGSEGWQVGSVHNITWTSANVSNVMIEYSTNNGSSWSTVVTSYPASSGTYGWTVPSAPSTQCKIRVSDVANLTTVRDESDNVFAITSSSSGGGISTAAKSPFSDLVQDISEVSAKVVVRYHQSLVSGSYLHVLWCETDSMDSNTYKKLAYRRSADGGRTFESKRYLGSLTKIGDPKGTQYVAVDGSNIHVVILDYPPSTDPSRKRLLYFRSTDNGATFDSQRQIWSFSQSNNFSAGDYAVTASNGNVNIFSSWRPDSGSGTPYVMSYNSKDNGATFTASTITSVRPKETYYWWWLFSDALSQGSNFYALASDFNKTGNYEQLTFMRSTNGGSSFSFTPISIANTSASFPDLQWNYSDTREVQHNRKISAENSDVHIIWEQKDVGANSYDLFYRLSVDGGATFGQTKKLTASLTKDDVHVGAAAIATKGNYVYVTYNYAATGSWRIGLFYSKDRGNTFSFTSLMNDTLFYAQDGRSAIPMIDPASTGDQVIIAYCTNQTWNQNVSMVKFNATTGQLSRKYYFPTFDMSYQSAPLATISSDGSMNVIVDGIWPGAYAPRRLYSLVIEKEKAQLADNYALRFDHNSSGSLNENLQIPYGPNLNITSALTIEGWIKKLSSGQILIAGKKGQGQDYYYYLGVSQNTNAANSKHPFASLRTTTKQYDLSAYNADSVAVNKWNHIAMTYDANGGTNNFKLYLNGRVVDSTTALGTIVNGPGCIFVNHMPSNWWSYPMGSVLYDELRFWSKARTINEINSSMGVQLQGTESGLAAYYPLNGSLKEGTGKGEDAILNYTGSFEKTAFPGGGTSGGSLPGEYAADGSTVLLLHMNETSGLTTTDASSYGNHGTANGTTIVPGRFGNARAFNGSSDYIRVPYATSLNGVAQMTLEGWAYLHSTRDHASILTRGTSIGVYSLKQLGGKLMLEIGDQYSNSVMLSGNTDLPLNKWVHLAAVIQGTAASLYMNGVLDQSGSLSIAPVGISSTEDLTVGVDFPGATEYLDGLIDEVRVSTKARLPQEFDLQLPPINLTASYSGGSVFLNWQNGGGAVALQRYKIYRGTDSTNVSLIDSTTAIADTNSTGLQAGTKYFYRVSPVDVTGFEGAKSYAAQATISGGGGGTEAWAWQNGTPTSNDLYAVKFLNASTGWALGDAAVLRTTNGGASWTRLKMGSPSLIYAFTFVDASTGWAVGGSPSYYANDIGTILKTIDGGTSWTKQTSGMTNTLYSVAFVNPNTGWAIGAAGTILKTTNGGSTWTSQTSGTTNDLKSVFFLDANTAWVVGNGGTVLKTTNGGSQWSALSSGTSKDLRSVTFTDANTGWAVGGDYYWTGSTATNTSLILKTTNGGTSWSIQSTGSSFSLYSVSFTDANNGSAVGGYVNWPNDYPMTYGAIQRTTNGGASWSTQSIGVISYLHSVVFTDANTGWAVGNAGTIVKTTNGGTTWSQQLATVTRDLLFAVSFVNANNGWICGTNKDNAGVLRTTNGGVTWTAMPAISTNPGLNSIDFVDVNTGWTVGWPGLIYKTTNGGQNWTSQTSGTNSVLRGVNFVDANTGWAVGNVGAIMKTSNGGSTWVNQGGGSAYYWCVFALNSSSAWVGGDNFSILKTSNGGTNWTPSYSVSGSADLVRAIAFFDANTGWGVGDAGRIVKTTNGGTTWTSQTSGTTNGLYGVTFTSATTAWVTGQGGMLLRTTDGGSSWNRQILPTYQDLFGVTFTSPNTGWIVGGNGTILNTTNGGITAVEKQEGTVPSSFALEQNYPNPFNPSTTIRYSLPMDSRVRIEIYNMLGQRVAGLVDGDLKAGHYTVVWNANVASGVYLYRIEAVGSIHGKDRFVSVKKMVVMK